MLFGIYFLKLHKMDQILQKIGNWIVWALTQCIELLNFVVTPIMTATFDAIMSNLPTGVDQDVLSAAHSISPYMNIANYWLPLDLAFLLFSSYIAISFSVISYRIIIKLIPTIG